MKKIALLACSVLSFNVMAKTIITEYIEGSSNNKAIEITNIGSSNVELGAEDYSLSLYINGRSDPSYTYKLSGILIPNSSLVIHNTGLTIASSFKPPLGLSENKAVNHNGDDSYILKKGDEVVDSFGQIGVDPGRYWGNSTNNSRNRTLRRKESITVGDSDPYNAFETLEDEWIFFDKNTLDGLGCSGESACTGNEAKPLQEGDGAPIDSCIFSRCDEVPLVKLRSDYIESIYYTKANAAINGDLPSFKQALHEDIKKDYNQLSYNQAWSALIVTDEDPENSDNVILLYTGKSIPKTQNASVLNNAPDSWNREHVWSKSHGFPNASQLGYTDIHHLRPADASINTLRSNYDFNNGGDPAEDGDIVTENNLLSGISWEPRTEVKGDVARMMFYMAVRYEENGDADMPDLILVDKVDTYGPEFGKLCTLYNWHINDPVGVKESERNDAIYEFQGNRNPFIDHPEWVEKLYRNQCNDTDVIKPLVYVNADEVTEGEDVSLVARVNKNDLTFLWTQESGILVTLLGADTSTVSFKAPDVDKSETVVLHVTVKDQYGNKHSTTAKVKIINASGPPKENSKKESSGGSINFSILILLSLFSLRKVLLTKKQHVIVQTTKGR